MIRFKSLRRWQRRKMNHKAANMSHDIHNIVTDIKQLKMSLSTPLQAGEGIEVYLHSFSISALDGCERSPSHPFALPVGNKRDANWIGNCVGSRAFMDF
jgi:hypothetical protein